MDRRTFICSIASAFVCAPSAARAQKSSSSMIGFLSIGSPADWLPLVAAFRLTETGFIEGKSVGIEFRWADGRSERLPALAADLVHRNVDVLVATGGPKSNLAAKASTSTH